MGGGDLRMNEDEVIHSQLTSLNLCELGYKPEPYQEHGETLIQSLAALLEKFPHAMIIAEDVLEWMCVDKF